MGSLKEKKNKLGIFPSGLWFVALLAIKKFNFETQKGKKMKLTIITRVLLDQGAGCGFKGIGAKVVERHQTEPEGGVRMRHGVQLLLRQPLGNVVLLVALHDDQVAAITVRG